MLGSIDGYEDFIRLAIRRFFSEYAKYGESHVTVTPVSINDFSYLNINIIIMI
jgi:hypothetical protein